MEEKIIAVDFDGTIVGNMFPKIGKIKSGILDYLKQKKAENYTLILWTCRTGTLLDDAINCCRCCKL